MGAIHFSLDIELVNALRKTLPLQYFVETGTFHGDTTAAMAPLFAKIQTVELSPEIFAETSKRLASIPNITMTQGESPATLQRLNPELAQESVLYWLDAHWCGGVTGGSEAECPLLDELTAIGRLNDTSAVLIDDARHFINPPPEPHKVADWPMLEEVVAGLKALSSDHKLWIINDVFIFVPSRAEADIVEYGRRRGVDLYRLYAAATAAAKTVKARDATIQALGQKQAAARPRVTIPLDAGAGVPARFNLALASDDRAERIFAFHLARLGLHRLLDIGANNGQFAARMRRLGYKGTIYSVEPQAKSYRELITSAQDDVRWLPLPKQGAGKKAGVVELNLSENSVSSSLLEVHANHLAAEPATRTVASEKIYVGKAGDLLRDDAMNNITALKIDVQGFEKMVLEGYGARLGQVRLLLLEMSLVECYKGAPDMFALDRYLTDDLGFSRVSFEPGYYDDRKGVVQQYDGIYYRPDAAPTARAQEGVTIGALVTSVGGPIQRKNSAGGEVGPAWRVDCANSWQRFTTNVVSVSETPPELPQVQWSEVPAKPSIAEMLRRAERLTDAHTALVNSDIFLTDGLTKALPLLDPDAVYCGRRHEVTLDVARPNVLTAKGVWGEGFDVFLLPPAFVREVNEEALLPDEFLIGEPWWDYLIRILAFQLGYPCKKFGLNDVFALHYSHEEQFSLDHWRSNGERALEAMRNLQKRKRSYAPALLTDLLEPDESLHAWLRRITAIVCFETP